MYLLVTRQNVFQFLRLWRQKEYVVHVYTGTGQHFLTLVRTVPRIPCSHHVLRPGKHRHSRGRHCVDFRSQTCFNKSLARCDKTQQFGVSAKSDNCIECSYRKYWCTDGKIYINGRQCTAEEIYIAVLSVDYSSDDTNSNEAINPSSISPNFLRTVLRGTCDVNVLQQTADDRRKKFHWIRDQR